MVLLMGLTETKAAQMTEEVNEQHSALFYSLEKWTPQLRTGHRLVWLLCWGIPLHAWDMEHIKQIATAVREVVEVDDDMDELHRLDRRRILVKTPQPPLIQHKISVWINRVEYTVHMVEETYYNQDRCKCWGRRFIGSSKEIRSVDSDLWLLTCGLTGWYCPSVRCVTVTT